MTKEKLSDIISTLITNGFNVNQVHRITSNDIILNVFKFDKLGAEIRYSILFTEDSYNTFDRQLSTISKAYNSKQILVGSTSVSNEYKSYSYKVFFDFFGGVINTGLILIPDLPNVLDQLGHNKLPIGLTGEANDIHELYISECFQFSMESPVRRYGSDRSFEPLPDGLIMGKDRFMILLDSKAYSGGFEFKADDIKRFASYVEDFNSRYSMYFGRAFSFVVVSGHFNDSLPAITGRSDELYKACGCKISCIKSSDLGNIVASLKEKPQVRSSIIWKNIFSEIIIEPKHVEQEIKRIIKDKVY